MLSFFFGRDDRCISDHGREAWFPFLDEKVVRFLQETPLDMVNAVSPFLCLCV